MQPRFAFVFVSLLAAFFAFGGIAISGCRKPFVGLSTLSSAEFDVDLELSRIKFRPNAVPWLMAKREATIQLPISAKSKLEAISQEAVCCGQTAAETKVTLEDLLVQHPDGEIPLQEYLEKSFRRAEAKHGFKCSNGDCITTALTHVDGLFPAGEMPATNREIITHYLDRVEKDAEKKWGDIIVIPGEANSVRHAIINLGNGLVFHKPGFGDATIEPLANAVARYRKEIRTYDFNWGDRLEVWRKKADPMEELHRSFRPMWVEPRNLFPFF